MAKTIKGVTIVIELSNDVSIGYEKNADSISIQFLWIGIDIICKTKQQIFKEMIDEFNESGF